MTPKKRPNTTRIETLWNDHRQTVTHSVASWSGHPVDDHDVQEAIAATYEKTLRYIRRGGKLDDDPSGWLITVARREFLRIITRTYNRAAPYLEDDDDQALIDPNPGPLEGALDHATRTLDGELDRALGRLTPRQRTVLTDLNHGYSYREIVPRQEIRSTWRV